MDSCRIAVTRPTKVFILFAITWKWKQNKPNDWQQQASGPWMDHWTNSQAAQVKQNESQRQLHILYAKTSAHIASWKIQDFGIWFTIWSYLIPSRKFFSETAIPQIYNKVKSEVKEKLSRAERVALTCDVWTSQAKESYVTLTAHYRGVCEYKCVCVCIIEINAQEKFTSLCSTIEEYVSISVCVCVCVCVLQR